MTMSLLSVENDKTNSPDLYNKYRPRDFDYVLGNDVTVHTLEALLQNPEAMPHLLLFVGPSGCGKTTLARIVAAKLGVTDLDWREIDASTDGSLDDIRNIRYNMHYGAVGGRFRIWFIDECSRLSDGAMHALLKTTEDCPPHVIFMLATTEHQKLPPTLRNRCSVFSVDPLREKDMRDLLSYVLKKEQRSITPEAMTAIIENAYGSPRQGLVFLGQIINLPPKLMAAAVNRAALR